MGQMDDNGLGIGAADPDAAAGWDRRAAEAGDPVGKFNLGLDMMRGRGVVADEAGARALVDRAAEADPRCAGRNRRPWKHAAAWKSTRMAPPGTMIAAPCKR